MLKVLHMGGPEGLALGGQRALPVQNFRVHNFFFSTMDIKIYLKWGDREVGQRRVEFFLTYYYIISSM